MAAHVEDAMVVDSRCVLEAESAGVDDDFEEGNGEVMELGTTITQPQEWIVRGIFAAEKNEMPHNLSARSIFVIATG